MTAHTKIEWADHTFNPWIGCTRVSEGCRHCYAETLATNRLGLTWGPQGARRRTAASTWKQPLAWNRKAQNEGRRFSVFPSMCDVFDDHPSIEPHWRMEFCDLIGETPRLDWLLLTKRPENIRKKISNFSLADGFRWVSATNVRIGISVEDQATADQRIPELLRNWAGPNFVSYEPALGMVDFRPWLSDDDGCEHCDSHCPKGTCPTERAVFRDGVYDLARPETCKTWRATIDWVIAGGESGPGARPAHPDWFRSVRDQCVAAGVPFFFKQWGEWVTEVQSPEDIVLPGHSVLPWVEFHERTGEMYGDETSVYRVGKKRAGRLLDGREWNEVPR